MDDCDQSWSTFTFTIPKKKLLEELVDPPGRTVYKMRKSLADYEAEKWKTLNRKSVFQRIFIMARNIDNDKKDFTGIFKEKLVTILKHCHEDNFRNEKITGLFVNMDSWSLLMVEGSEDILAEFFIELEKIDYYTWTDSRVFDITDDIGKVMFDKMISCEIAPVYSREKFASNLAEDMEEMGKMHIEMLKKMLELCKDISQKIKTNSINLKLPLSKVEYSGYLPETQRMEIVMKSKFYRTIRDFSKIYGSIDLSSDEQAYSWPIPYNYVPVGVFDRSDYHVNLTFPDMEENKNVEKDNEEDDH